MGGWGTGHGEASDFLIMSLGRVGFVNVGVPLVIWLFGPNCKK